MMKGCVAVAASMLLLSGCGGSSEASAADRPGSSPPSTLATTTAPATTKPTKTGPTLTATERREDRACLGEMQPLLRKLENLDSRLDIGLTKVDYGTALGDVSVGYNRVDFGGDDINLGCLALVGSPLESAFNAYIRANNRWDNCIDDYGCDVDQDVLPFLQGQWSQASTKVERARTRLDHLRETLEEAD